MLVTMQPSLRPVVSAQMPKFWTRIWKLQGIIPRIRIFLWKALHNALPVGKVLHRRFDAIPSTCSLCSHCTDDVLHGLFRCCHARATWFTCPLSFRTTSLQGSSLSDTLLVLFQSLSDQQVALFINTMWQIWKA